MLEAGTMLLFCAVLFASVALGWSIIPALFVGVLLFMGYGLVRRCSLRAMASRAAGSVRSAGTVVVAFVLIGVLTSLWRASGTIAFIVAHSTAVIHAATVIPLSFRPCSAMSVLVGSSFASAATMGTICMSLGLSMQANPVMLGGADSCGRLCGRSLFAGFHQCLAGQTAYAYEPVQYYCPHAAHGCGAVCAELCGIRCGCGGGVAVRERWFRIWCG